VNGEGQDVDSLWLKTFGREGGGTKLFELWLKHKIIGGSSSLEMSNRVIDQIGKDLEQAKETKESKEAKEALLVRESKSMSPIMAYTFMATFCRLMGITATPDQVFVLAENIDENPSVYLVLSLKGVKPFLFS